MQTVGAQLTAVLQSQARDLIWLFELYSSDYQPGGSGFDPRDAVETFSGVSFTLPFGPVVYRRQVLQGPSIKKTIGKEFNTATVRFSNLSEDENGSRYMAQFVLNNEVEQMRLVVRSVSRSVAVAIGNDISILANSVVEFVGRCGKPDGFNRSVGTISAKPDMGTVEARLPPRQFQASCPLEFKGPECLGTEDLGDKSAAYQAAAICNKQEGGDCTTFENTEFFQGQTLVQIQSSFVHKSNQGLLGKLIHWYSFGLFGKRKKVDVNNSIHDGTAYGSPIPLIFGRWYKTLLALQYQDIGTSINFLMAACRGKISDFINIKSNSLNFTQPIGLTKHLGEFGGEGTQTEDTVFPQGGFYSRLAYITGFCNGSDIEAEDPAPTISAVIAGTIPDQIYFDVDHDGTGKLAAGTGGVSAAGSSVSAPGTQFDSYDEAITPTDPEAYWKLDSSTVPTVYPNTDCEDSSPNGNDGALIPLSLGSNLTVNIPGFLETESPGDGMSGAIAQIPHIGNTAGDLRPSSTKFSFSCRAKHTASGCEIMIAHGGDVANTYAAFGTRSTGTFADNVVFVLELEGSLTFGLVSEIIPTNTVVSVACVRDGAFMGIWINGCLSASRNDLPPEAICEPQDSPWRLGFLPNIIFGPVFQSAGMSRAAIYPNAALTEDQIKSIHASAVNTPIGCPGADWTDNPVDHAFYILTEPSLMGNDPDSVDHFLSAYAAAWNCGAVKDDSNAERCLLPNTETSKVGVEYKRYNSTGFLSPQSFEATRTQIPAGVPARECDYEFFAPATPPTSLDELVVYRKRSTCNIEFSEVQKAVDVLYDKIFPTFSGFLRWNTKGQTVIDSARPADWTTMRAASIVGATTILVQDVLPWKNTLGSPYLLEGKVHLDRRISFIFDNAAIRTAVPNPVYTAADVGKYALQKDTNTIWQLTAITPTWTQITTQVSEVRRVTTAVYSALGDAITLASSASGGPVATASGANLSGGSTTVQSSATVTITGALTEGATITVEVDGIECVLTLLSGETSAIIGHRMACVINATPGAQEYVEAHATANVVTIYAKVGVLTLASALEEAHDAQTEVTRVMASFAGKALTYADTTRANVLDGTFGWPDAGRQSLVNQIKAKYRESVRDFGEQPITVNDFNHQRKTRKVNTFEVDHSAIDNYNQSARLANGLLNRLRDGDMFFDWQSMGEALLLDEGDVVCVSDDSGPFRNQLCRIEEKGTSSEFKAAFIARKYSRIQVSDLVAEPAGLLIPSALTNFESAPPDISFNEADFPPNGLEQSTDGTAMITSIRGGVIFGPSIYPQYAKIRLIKRGGVAVDQSINDHLDRNADFEGTFEVPASIDGLYTVQAQACNQWGCSAIVTADIVIGFGTLFGIATEGGVLITTEGGDFIEQEHP